MIGYKRELQYICFIYFNASFLLNKKSYQPELHVYTECVWDDRRSCQGYVYLLWGVWEIIRAIKLDWWDVNLFEL